MTPRETLTAFDRFLAERSLLLDAVVVGGAALNLLGIVWRPTKDCDIVDPPLVKEIKDAARAFAAQMRANGDTLGRGDLLRAKLWALCDRGLDLTDCLALAPTAVELIALLPWLEKQDANPDWPAHARTTLADLGRRLGHGV